MALRNTLHSFTTLNAPPTGHSADNIPYSRPVTPGASEQPLKIGWVGLGAMGYPMARNLAATPPTHPAVGLPIKVWNRSDGKSHELVKELGEGKVSIAQSPGELAVECDIIFTSLASDEVVEIVYGQFAEALKTHPPSKAKIFVETSTIYPTVAGKLDKLISSIPHCRLITSPVFGPPAAAKEGHLVAYLAGDYQSKKLIAHLLVPAVARKVTDLGGNLEKAPTMKLIGNSMILGCLELLAESFTLGAKSGIDQQIIHDWVKEMFPVPLFAHYGDKMLNNKFDGSIGFGIDGGIKDASHIRRLTSQVNSPMPVTDVAHQHLLAARAIHTTQARTGAQDFEVLDWSALIAGTRVAAGLDPFHKDEPSGVVKDD
ncbi:NAD-P-binding protein [Peniophora sp. CONT]|nr:NAD-P-binding protein [Peniophora sp. CONT]